MLVSELKTGSYADSGIAQDCELSLTEILDAVDQAMALGARRIIVLGGGEPLVHPDIPTILRQIHQRGAAIDLFTNGTRITADLAGELMALGVSPVIKMNSLREDVQDMLADRPGTFAKNRRGLQHLRDAGYPAPDLPLGVQTVICRQNLAELSTMWAWIRDHGMTPYFETITLQGWARKHPELLVGPEEIRSLFQTLAELDKTRYGMEWDPRPPARWPA